MVVHLGKTRLGIKYPLGVSMGRTTHSVLSAEAQMYVHTVDSALNAMIAVDLQYASTSEKKHRQLKRHKYTNYYNIVHNISSCACTV